jgi:hypothetical protein
MGSTLLIMRRFKEPLNTNTWDLFYKLAQCKTHLLIALCILRLDLKFVAVIFNSVMDIATRMKLRETRLITAKQITSNNLTASNATEI